MHEFNDRVLLLTGAAGGIGRAVAQHFHALGAQLVLADQDEAGVVAFGASLDPGGQRVASLRMDAADPADAERAVRLASDRFGAIDFLVPAAGVFPQAPIREMTDAQWRQTLSVNLDGVFYLCSRVIPLLRAGSAIVNIASVAAHRGSPCNAHYAASKGGLISFTRSLARELGPRTRVNAVSPGFIDTAMTHDLVGPRGAATVAQTPLGRLGRAEDVAAAIAFLCSSDAGFITGEILHVNGGLYMD